MSALESRGMDEVWSIVEQHRAKLGATGELDAKRREQQGAWLWSMVEEGLKQHFLGRSDVQRMIPALEAEVASSRITPTEAARRLLELVLDRGRP